MTSELTVPQRPLSFLELIEWSEKLTEWSKKLSWSICDGVDKLGTLDDETGEFKPLAEAELEQWVSFPADYHFAIIPYPSCSSFPEPAMTIPAQNGTIEQIFTSLIQAYCTETAEFDKDKKAKVKVWKLFGDQIQFNGFHVYHDRNLICIMLSS